MAVARYLVQGVDVWLNTPLRPFEASGTSGMKATANGVLNLSTLDGWWDEAWDLKRQGPEPPGWAVGRGEAYDTREQQDQVEAEALYELLERDLVPLFYDRNHDRLPRRWIARMKASLATLCCLYNTHRMVKEYTERFYLVAHAKFNELEADSAVRARSLAAWLARVRRGWSAVKVQNLVCPAVTGLSVGERISVRAAVELGSLTADDVCAEMYFGRLDARGDIEDAVARRMESIGRDSSGRYIFEASAVPCTESGLHGFTVRVVPDHPDLTTAFQPGLVTWAEEHSAAASPAR
jgi:starch phosphorylase